jgi:hypothetical protein
MLLDERLRDRPFGWNEEATIRQAAKLLRSAENHFADAGKKVAVPSERKPRWIPCSERLPETRGDYITWWEDEGRAAIIGFDRGWMWGDGSRMRDSKRVTHWMSPPEAPK